MNKPKNFTIYFLLVLTVMVTGCKKDDSEPVTPTLAGTWHITSSDTIECTDSSRNQISTYDSSERTFTANTLMLTNELIIYNYTVDGNVITMTRNTNGTTESFSATFELTAHTLSITYLTPLLGAGCKVRNSFIR